MAYVIVLKKIFIKEIAKHPVPTKYRVLFTLKIIIGVKIGVKTKKKEPESAFLLHSSALIVLNYIQFLQKNQSYLLTYEKDLPI